MVSILQEQTEGVPGKSRIQTAIDLEKQVGNQVIEVYRITLDLLKKGIVSGAANVPLSLRSLQGFEDLLHGGAYNVPANKLPYYNPGVQAQIAWSTSTVGGVLTAFIGATTLVDINPDWEPGTLPGQIKVIHSHPIWISLPPGAKPEQAEIIINSGVGHVLPKVLSDQEFYLAKEWDSLFFTTALLTGISTNIRTLVQAGDEVVKTAAEAVLE